MLEYTIAIIGAFLLSSICGFFFIPALLNFCKRKNLYDMPNQRKVHKCLVPRLGGISFMPSMLLSFFIVTIIMGTQSVDAKITISTWTLGLLISFLIIYSTGIMDDLIGLDAKVKFATQIIAACILPFCGLYINNLYGLFGIHAIPYYMGFPLTILTIVFIDNAMNLIDGIDGLSASLSIIALAGFAYCFIHNGLIVYAILIAGLIGILVTYLYFNIWGDPNKNRKIFMGDSGSLTLGFILGFLFVKALRNDPRVMPFSPERIVLAYSFLIVPTFDVVRVIIHRLRAHKPIFDADKSHIHHKMMAAGLNQHQALVGILCLELLFVCINLVSFDYLNCNITYMFIIDVVIYTIFHIVLTKRIQQCTIASGKITNEK